MVGPRMQGAGCLSLHTKTRMKASSRFESLTPFFNLWDSSILFPDVPYRSGRPGMYEIKMNMMASKSSPERHSARQTGIRHQSASTALRMQRSCPRCKEAEMGICSASERLFVISGKEISMGSVQRSLWGRGRHLKGRPLILSCVGVFD